MPPPPKGIPPGICKFFLSWWSTSPFPGTQKEQIFLRVLFLGTKCEIQEHPQTGTLTQGYKNSTRQQHFTEENGTKTLLRLCRSAFHRKPS